MDEFIAFENIVNSSSNFYWDFCVGDVASNAVSTPVLENVASAGGVSGLEIVEGGGSWYGFLTNRDNNTIHRLSFGTSPSNSPVIESLGNIGGLLNGPETIKLKKEGSNWYGLVANSNDSKLLRLSFGTDLGSVPEVSDLGSFGVLNGPRGLSISRDGGSWVVVVTNFDNELTMIRFGSSLSNTPDSGTDVIHTAQLPNDTQGLTAVDVVKICDSYYGLASGWSTDRIYHLSFGTSLFSSPVVTDITGNITAISQGGRLRIVQDGDEYYVILLTLGGKVIRLGMGDDFTTTPSYTELLTLAGANTTYSLSLVNEESTWYGFAFNFNGSGWYRLGFDHECSSSQGLSEESEPAGVYYSSAGTYRISLTGIDENGNNHTVVKEVVVGESTAPDIEFSVDSNRCVGVVNNFTSQSSITGLTYSWDFNSDGTPESTDANPLYQFPSAGAYDVLLTVENEAGCANTARETIVIYPQPAPVFDFSYTGELCSNKSLAFSDATPNLPPDSLVTWTWNFNGEATILGKDTAYAFANHGENIITLTVAIPGCEGSAGSSIELLEGPKVDFSIPEPCLYGEITFQNLSEGRNITGYQWHFGNGYTSSQTSPSLLFSEAGDYQVSLTATNSLGCDNSMSRTVSLRGVPEVKFSHELACSGSPVVFTDQSVASLANVVQWHWQFGGLGSSGEQNPEFIFPEAGTYEVSLTATTNFGCSATVAQKVVVLESPAVNFSVGADCAGQPIKFSDRSTSNSSISSRLWEINGSTYTTDQVSEIFEVAGEYDARLEITSENLCSSSMAKKFRVYPNPELDFTYTSSCDNELIEFEAQSYGAGAIVSRVWDFAGQAPANGARAFYRFSQAGNYTVSLTASDTNNCSTLVSKTVAVNKSPEAAFSHTSTFGQVPVQVMFSDESTGAAGRQWFVDDGLEPAATGNQFSHTFGETGEYLVSLVATNEAGCSDTLSRILTIAAPKLDLQLKSIGYTEDNGRLKFILNIANRGTYDLSGFTILINIDDKVTVSENFSGSLPGGKTMAHMLNFDLVLGQAAIDKICMELVPPSFDDDQEFTPHDNKNCIVLSESYQVSHPFPNPVENELFMDLILPADGNVEISILGMSGQPMLQQSYPNMKAGLSVFRFEVSHFKPALYLLKIRVGERETVQRFFKR